MSDETQEYIEFDPESWRAKDEEPLLFKATGLVWKLVESGEVPAVALSAPPPALPPLKQLPNSATLQWADSQAVITNTLGGDYTSASPGLRPAAAAYVTAWWCANDAGVPTVAELLGLIGSAVGQAGLTAEPDPKLVAVTGTLGRRWYLDGGASAYSPQPVPDPLATLVPTATAIRQALVAALAQAGHPTPGPVLDRCVAWFTAWWAARPANAGKVPEPVALTQAIASLYGD